MEYTFTRLVGDYEETKVDNGGIIYNRIGSHNEHFTVYVNPERNNLMTVTKDGVTKTVKVVADYEFIYKAQKSQIKARDGATGLFNYIKGCIEKKSCECLAYSLLNHVIDVMRPVKN